MAEFTLSHAETFQSLLSPPKSALLTIEALRGMKYATGLIMLLRQGRVFLNRTVGDLMENVFMTTFTYCGLLRVLVPEGALYME